jgi:succinoglycan biosynthesis protein ExoA
MAQPTRNPANNGQHVDGDELVTVVIPARDEQDAIGDCLDSLLAQTYRNLQVIVVDGASRDATAAIVRARAEQDHRVELILNPDALIPISLNLALAAAKGRWLVRVDAHATVPADYVATAVGHLATGRWGGVGGRKDGVGITPAGRAIAVAMASPFGVGNSAYHYAEEPREVDHVPFGSYPVDLARRLGGWDERLAVNQDFEFDYRVRSAGHRLLLDPALTINWQCRQSVPDLFRQYRRYGRGKAKVARLHPDSLQPRHLAAPVLVLALLTSALLFVVGRRRLATGLLAPYLAGVAGASVHAGRQVSSPDERRMLAPAFIAMHTGWGIGFWRGVVDALRWRPTPWQGTLASDSRSMDSGRAPEA